VRENLTARAGPRQDFDGALLARARCVGFAAVEASPTTPQPQPQPEPKRKEKGPYLSAARIHWSEYLGMAGAGVLFLSLFLPWFSAADCSQNPNSALVDAGTGCGESASAFQVYGMLWFWLTAACIAPFVLTWIVARSHKLTWRPGEITMIVGITAFALIVMNGIILGKPDNGVEISFGPGYVVGIIGALMICAGGVIRQGEGGRTRKVPGQI